MADSLKDWSKPEEELLKTLRPTMTITQLYQEFEKAGFTRSRKAIERKACNLGVFYNPPPKPQEIDSPDRYSEALHKILSLKQEYIQEYEHRLVGIVPPDKITRKILSLSDPHIPFDREDLIRKVVEEHSDADILVVNGDLFDLYAVSTWPKEKSVILKREYEIAMEYVKWFCDVFKLVFFTRGNHEYRLNRYFHANVSKDVSFMINKEILGRLLSGEVYDDDGNVVKRYSFPNAHYESGPQSWFLKIGKTMFVHPQSFSSVEARTVINAQQYFMERTDIDCICLGHTHQIAKVPTRNKLCIEQGCLCCPLDYEKQGKLKYKAMALGYAIIYQDAEGNCDFNKSGPVYLGTQYPIKPDFDDIIDKLNR